MANIAGHLSAVIQAGGKSGRMQGVTQVTQLTGPTAPFLINEDFTVDPSWSATGNSNVTGGELVSITSGGSEDHQDIPTFSDETTVWFSFDITIDTGFTIATVNNRCTLFGIQDGGLDMLGMELTNNAGTVKFQSVYRGDSSTVRTPITTPALVLGQTYTIIGQHVKNTGTDVTDGIRNLWIDDASVLNITNLDDDTRNIDRARAGFYNTSATPAGTNRIDNIKISTTGVAP